MSLTLREFLAAHSQFSDESGKRLLLYVSFAQCFCQQYSLICPEYTPLEGLLPLLFRQIPGYTIKEAAITFDSAMPWPLLHGNAQLSAPLNRFRQELIASRCATPAWLLEQLDDLFELDGTLFGVSATPPTLCALIAQLAAQRPAEQIIDLCCGTYALGLRIWQELGASPKISCLGEEINGYLCAFARLLLFLCGVQDVSIQERDITQPLTEPIARNTPTIFAADFPFTGNRAQATSKSEPNTRIYADWRMLRALLDRMRPGDRAFVLVTKGALVRQNERALRAELVHQDWLDAVIQLPPGLFADHNLPLSLMVCEKSRPAGRRGKVFFADLSAAAIPATRRTKRLSCSGIDHVCHAFSAFATEASFSIVVPTADVERAGWSLYPPAYLAQNAFPDSALRLGDVADITRGAQHTASASKTCHTPRYLLNVRDLQNGEILFEGADEIESTPSLERKYRIQEDDILITSKGSALKLAIVPPEPPAAYLGGNLTRIRLRGTQYSPYLLYEYLTSEHGQTALNLIQTGTTIRVLGSTNLQELTIPNYDPELAAAVGAELKSAVLQHRRAKKELEDAYTQKKAALLLPLNLGKEQDP